MTGTTDAELGWDAIPPELAAVARRCGVSLAELIAVRDDPTQVSGVPDLDDDDWDRITAPTPGDAADATAPTGQPSSSSMSGWSWVAEPTKEEPTDHDREQSRARVRALSAGLAGVAEVAIGHRSVAGTLPTSPTDGRPDPEPGHRPDDWTAQTKRPSGPPSARRLALPRPLVSRRWTEALAGSAAPSPLRLAVAPPALSRGPPADRGRSIPSRRQSLVGRGRHPRPET